MADTLGIVEVTCRKPGPNAPCLKRLASGRFGGKSLLEWIVRRVTDSQQLDGVIAVCNGDIPDDILRLVPPDVPVFQCDAPHSLDRVATALKKYPTRAIVRVGLNAPFVDPALIDRLVSEAQQDPRCDYVAYCLNDGKPVVRSPLGLFAEWCKVSAIRKATRDGRTPLERSDATRYVCSHPELFQLRLIPIPPELDRDDLRLTIGEQEDWDNAEAIYEALGPDSLDWQRIAGLLYQQPGLRQRMAVLNRAEAMAQT